MKMSTRRRFRTNLEPLEERRMNDASSFMALASEANRYAVYAETRGAPLLIEQDEASVPWMKFDGLASFQTKEAIRAGTDGAAAGCTVTKVSSDGSFFACRWTGKAEFQPSFGGSTAVKWLDDRKAAFGGNASGVTEATTQLSGLIDRDGRMLLDPSGFRVTAETTIRGTAVSQRAISNGVVKSMDGRADVTCSIKTKITSSGDSPMSRVSGLWDRRSLMADSRSRCVANASFTGLIWGDKTLKFSGTLTSTQANGRMRGSARWSDPNYLDVLKQAPAGGGLSAIVEAADRVLSIKLPIVDRSIGSLVDRDKAGMASLGPLKMLAEDARPNAMASLRDGKDVALMTVSMKKELMNVGTEVSVPVFEMPILGLARASLKAFLSADASVGIQATAGLSSRGFFLGSNTGIVLTASAAGGLRGDISVMGYNAVTAKGSVFLEAQAQTGLVDADGNGRVYPGLEPLKINGTLKVRGGVELKGCVNLILTKRCWGKRWPGEDGAELLSVDLGVPNDDVVDYGNVPRTGTALQGPVDVVPGTRSRMKRVGSSEYSLSWAGSSPGGWQVLWTEDGGKSFKKLGGRLTAETHETLIRAPWRATSEQDVRVFVASVDAKGELTIYNDAGARVPRSAAAVSALATDAVFSSATGDALEEVGA
jgi:hypothetical protein